MRSFYQVLALSLSAFLWCCPAGKATGDSLNYLTPKDTVFLSVGPYNEKVFEHKMEKKQTLYSLAKFYGLSVEELYLYNPGLKEQAVRLGQAILVPIPNRAITRYKIDGFVESEHVPVFYVVRKGDTMYRIAGTYFRMPMVEIMDRNEMDVTDVKPGQRLLIGWMKLSGIPEEYRQFDGGPLARRNHAMRQIYIRECFSKKEHEHQGVAYWKTASKEDSDLYALHREAPLNAVIAVTNPMTNRTVYAKVIGKIPDSAYGNDVIVVLSPLAAKLLGAVDPRFFIRVKYCK
jgi:LysM repeat protein